MSLCLVGSCNNVLFGKKDLAVPLAVSLLILDGAVTITCVVLGVLGLVSVLPLSLAASFALIFVPIFVLNPICGLNRCVVEMCHKQCDFPGLLQEPATD